MKKFFPYILTAILLVASADMAYSGTIRQYKLKVVVEYPHDVTSYTQGLFFNDGQLYESTGQYGSSTLRKVDLSTGKALQRVDFNKNYFVEGSVMFGQDIYVLTWVSKIAFVYDANTFKAKKAVRYPREGWGITTDGTQLIASDGSSTLYFMDSALNVTRRVNVTVDGTPLRWLNELEYIDGKIWANVYTYDEIVIINPTDGKVEGVIDCRGLLPEELKTYDTDVLNGIAYNPKNGKIYITGKNWPKLYEIKLVE
jgi:glutamine cyclotransferase